MHRRVKSLLDFLTESRLNFWQDHATPEMRPGHRTHQEEQEDCGEPDRHTRVQVADRNPRSQIKPRPKHFREGSPSRPPQIQSRDQHHDGPAIAQFEHPVARLPKGPPPMQGAAEPGQPIRRCERPRTRAIGIHENRHGEAVDADRRDCGAARRIERNEDVLNGHVWDKCQRRTDLVSVSRDPIRRYDEAQLRMTDVHPPFGPEIKRPGRALPQHKWDHEHGREEMPSPEDGIEPTVGHRNAPPKL